MQAPKRSFKWLNSLKFYPDENWRNSLNRPRPTNYPWVLTDHIGNPLALKGTSVHLARPALLVWIIINLETVVPRVLFTEFICRAIKLGVRIFLGWYLAKF